MVVLSLVSVSLFTLILCMWETKSPNLSVFLDSRVGVLSPLDTLSRILY